MRSLSTVSLPALFLAASLFSVAGCADAEESVALSEDGLRDGELTYERPAIGLMLNNDWTGCTATLIDDDTLVTAAHCFDYGSQAPSGKRYGAFHIKKSDTDEQIFEYDGFVSLGRKSGSDDIALVHLMKKVPADVAKPLAISTSAPSDASNELVTMYGVGCQHRPGLFGPSDEPEPNMGKKQKRTFEMGPVRYGCPGDSGGPTVRKDGSVFRVTSKMYFVEIRGWGRGDSFGDVVKWRDRIQQQISAWR